MRILAGHAGRWLAQELEAAGIPVDAVWVEGETRSSLSVADRAGAGLTEFYERGAGGRPWRWAELAARAVERSGGAEWMTVSGSLPPGASPRGYRDLGAGCPVALDSAEPSPPRVELVKLNAAEAALLTGLDTASADGALAAARERSRGATRRRRSPAVPTGAVLVAADGSAVARERWTRPGATRWEAATRSWPAWSSPAPPAPAGPTRCALALGAAAANAAVPGAGRFERVEAERLAGLAVASARRERRAGGGVEDVRCRRVEGERGAARRRLAWRRRQAGR